MDKEKQTEMTEIEVVQKPKFKERISKLYPDAAMETEEDIETLYNRYADDKENELTGMKDNMQVIEDLMNSDEDLRAVLTDMIVNKTPFRAAIAKYLSQDDLTPLPTDEDYEAVRTAYNERVERGKSQAAAMEEIRKNEENTYNEFESFVAEKNLDEIEAKELDDIIGEVFSNLLYKKITREMLEMFLKAKHYDADLAKADSEGEIRGRNAAIEAKRIAAESKKGDGVPYLVGGSAEPEKERDNDRVSFLGKKRNNI